MAVFKFYNLQLLPIEKNVEEVGQDGYSKLFESVQNLLEECKKNKRRLSSIAYKMRGEMYLSPFAITEYTYSKEKNKTVIYGSFLKFDDVDVLIDTNSGETEYRSNGNTSSRRYDLEFYFDPSNHILAIQDAKGLPTRRPLIEALNNIFSPHAIHLFKKHSLEIEELTSADSIYKFFEIPKKGYKRYSGIVTFSNSDAFDEAMEGILATEIELKEKRVGKWQADYQSFPQAVMNDLPDQAKIQLGLATKYGNAEVSYIDEHGAKKKYQMEDYPVREHLKQQEYKGIKGKAIAVLGLIKKAIDQTKLKNKTVKENNDFIKKDGE